MKSTHSDRPSTFRLPHEVELGRMQRVIREELTDLQRYTLEAYYFRHQSLSRIARDRNVNKSTVCRTLHRAVEKLRRYLLY